MLDFSYPMILQVEPPEFYFYMCTELTQLLEQYCDAVKQVRNPFDVPLHSDLIHHLKKCWDTFARSPETLHNKHGIMSQLLFLLLQLCPDRISIEEVPPKTLCLYLLNYSHNTPIPLVFLYRRVLGYLLESDQKMSYRKLMQQMMMDTRLTNQDVILLMNPRL